LEDNRKSRLLSSFNGDQKQLRPLWPPGCKLEVFVFLLDSPLAVEAYTVVLQNVAGDGGDAADETHERFTKPKVTWDLSHGVIGLFDAATFHHLPNTTWDLLAIKQTSDYRAVNQTATADNKISQQLPIWHLRGTLDLSPSNYVDQVVQVMLPPTVVERNETLFAHVFISRRPSNGEWVPEHNVIHHVEPLVVFKYRKPVRKVRNLMNNEVNSGISATEAAANTVPSVEQDQPDSEESKQAWVRYWRPTLHIQLVLDSSAYVPRSLPPHIAHVIQARALMVSLTRTILDFPCRSNRK
jgi:hypothetical protein